MTSASNASADGSTCTTVSPLQIRGQRAEKRKACVRPHQFDRRVIEQQFRQELLEEVAQRLCVLRPRCNHCALICRRGMLQRLGRHRTDGYKARSCGGSRRRTAVRRAEPETQSLHDASEGLCRQRCNTQGIVLDQKGHEVEERRIKLRRRCEQLDGDQWKRHTQAREDRFHQLLAGIRAICRLRFVFLAEIDKELRCQLAHQHQQCRNDL